MFFIRGGLVLDEIGEGIVEVYLRESMDSSF